MSTKRRMLRPERRSRRNVILTLVLLAALVVPGRQLERSGAPTVYADTASGLTVDPATGPAGSTVSVSLLVSGGAASVGRLGRLYFDDFGTLLDSPTWQQCTTTTGYTGFGTLCTGSAEDITVPPDAALGSHQVFFSYLHFAYYAAFVVTAPATATPTSLPSDTSTATGTPTVTSTSTASPTISPSASSTGTPTATPTISSSASATVTASNTPLSATAMPATATAVPSPTRVVLPSPSPTPASLISVARLQQVQGGCLAPPSQSVDLSPGHNASSRTAYAGGQSVHVHIPGLQPDTAFDLIFSGPRAIVSGAASVPIAYSPPPTGARTDRSGVLNAAVVLPEDTAGGTATILVVPHSPATGASHPNPVAQWTFQTTPRPPSLSVSLVDSAGHPVRGATLTYIPSSAVSATGVSLRSVCGQTSVSGAATFLAVASGQGQVIASLGKNVVASAQVQAAPGATTHISLVSAASQALACNLAGSEVYGLYDRESGGTGASSGTGPFGTFISGVQTLDTFKAMIDDGVPLNEPVSLTFQPAKGSAPGLTVAGHIESLPIAYSAAQAQRAPGVMMADYHYSTVPAALAAASGAPGAGQYVLGAVQNESSILRILTSRFYLFPDIDLSQLAPGAWNVKLTLGDNSRCPSVYRLTMIANPWRTPLGTIQPVYDQADHAYYSSDTLPNSGLVGQVLHFSTSDIPVGWDPYDVDGIVTIPGFHAPFPNLASTDAGIDVNERLYTSGRWDGFITAHAKIQVIGISLADSELPTFSGSGQNLARDQFTVYSDTLASNNQLGGQPLLVVPIGFPGIAGGEFKLGVELEGSLNASVGVAAVLNRVTLTVTPALTAGIVASAEADLAGSSAGVNVNGNLILQAPVSVSIPDGVQAHLAVRFSVTGHAYAHFCFISCTGPDVDFTIVAPTCLLGDCTVINPAFALAPAAVPMPGRASLVSRLYDAVPAAAGVAGRAAAGHAAASVRISPGPRYQYPAQPVTAYSTASHQATLWVDSSGGVVRLLARVDGGATETIADSRAQIAAPTVAWIGPDRALAVWVGNTAPPAQISALGGQGSRPDDAALATALSGQELYSAAWDGRTWSTPRRLTTDNLADTEPALAADPRTGLAVLLWTHSSNGVSTADVLQKTSVLAARYGGGRWLAPVPITTVDGAHAPVAAVSLQGSFSAAWLQGTGSAAKVLFAPALTGPRPAATSIRGLPAGLTSLRLALDGAGDPVLAVAGTSLAAARRAPSGTWTVWQMGNGSLPRLAAKADGSVLFAAVTSNGTASQSLSARVLPLGGTWGGAVPLANAGATPAGLAAAIDPRTGTLLTLLQGASSSTALDASMQLHALDVPAAGHLALVSQGVALSPPQPAPGTQASVQVQVENTGIATLPAGSIVTLRTGFVTRALRLAAPLLPGATTTLRTGVVMPSTALQISALAGGGVVKAALGLPPAPTTLGNAPAGSAGELQLNWAAAADPDVVGYRIYRGLGSSGPLSMVGIAGGTLWLDAQRETGRSYTYRVTAIDRFGRESLLSTALSVAP